MEYKIKTANEQEILLHLEKCNNNFTPPLDQKVILKDYAKKLFEKSVTFEAWKEKSLIGLIACYFTDTKKGSSYITNVSVTPEFNGKGIATELMNNCIGYAKDFFFNEINLEVHQDNKDAIHLYNKSRFIGFENKGSLLLMKLKLNT
jgi:ribosomal protein S18 acetylase RimI-like enzyme